MGARAGERGEKAGWVFGYGLEEVVVVDGASAGWAVGGKVLRVADARVVIVCTYLGAPSKLPLGRTTRALTTVEKRVTRGIGDAGDAAPGGGSQMEMTGDNGRDREREEREKRSREAGKRRRTDGQEQVWSGKGRARPGAGWRPGAGDLL